MEEWIWFLARNVLFLLVRKKKLNITRAGLAIAIAIN
jgi:hypothetical protein